jgi:hypothetical protein
MEYGTGAIFGCPAHDQRDLDFARKYGLSGDCPWCCRSPMPRPSRSATKAYDRGRHPDRSIQASSTGST